MTINNPYWLSFTFSYTVLILRLDGTVQVQEDAPELTW